MFDVTVMVSGFSNENLFDEWKLRMSRQTYRGHIQYILLRNEDESGQPVSVKDSILLASPEIASNFVIIMSPDYYYGPQYISLLVGKLKKLEIVGETTTRNYNVARNSYNAKGPENSLVYSLGFQAKMLDKVLTSLTEDGSVSEATLWEGAKARLTLNSSNGILFRVTESEDSEGYSSDPTGNRFLEWSNGDSLSLKSFKSFKKATLEVHVVEEPEEPEEEVEDDEDIEEDDVSDEDSVLI